MNQELEAAHREREAVLHVAAVETMRTWSTLDRSPTAADIAGRLRGMADYMDRVSVLMRAAGDIHEAKRDQCAGQIAGAAEIAREWATNIESEAING